MSGKKSGESGNDRGAEKESDIPLADDITRPQVPGFKITGQPMVGSMGDVWKGVELSTKRKVAIKFMNQILANSDRARIRFTGEVEISAKLDHPNIARVYSCNFDSRPYYYVMEWIEGVRLDTFVKQNNLTERQIIELMCSVCDAVQHAHQRGIIHRDLKPSNILTTADGQPKVLDFGLAKLDEQDAQLSVDGDLTGTPSYMSPEQARGEMANVETRSDVYSLGVILFLLLTERNPHDTTGGAHVVIGRVANEEARTPAQVGANLNRELCAILAKALAREKDDRYGSAGELQADLMRYLSGDAISARIPTFSYIVGKQFKKHKKRIAAAIFIVLLAAGATVAGYFRILDERNKADTARAELAANQQTLIDARDEAIKERARADEQAAIAQTQAQRADEQAQAAIKAAAQERQARDELLANQQALIDAKNAAVKEAEDLKKAQAGELAANTAAQKANLDAQKSAIESKKATLIGNYKGYITNIEAADSAIAAGHLADARRYLAACPENFRNWEWQYLNARCDSSLLTFQGHTNRVNSVALSPDGSRIASAANDTTIRIWDAVTAKQLGLIRGHTGIVYSVQFSPDGTKLLSAGSAPDNTVRIWDADNGKELVVMRGVEGPVGAAFSPDGKRVATVARDKTIRLWNAISGVEMQKLTIANPLFDVAFSPDGSHIAAGAASGNALIWDPRMTAPSVTLNGHDTSNILGIRYSPDGAHVVTSSADATARVWDANSGKQLFVMSGTIGNVHAGTFSHDGTKIVTGGNDQTLRLWDASNGTPISVFCAPSNVMATAFSADDSRIVTGSADGVVRLWSAESDGAYPILHGEQPIARAAFIDGDKAVLTITDAGIQEWDARTGKQVQSRDFPPGISGCLKIDPAGMSIVAAASDDTAHVFPIKPGGQQMVLKGHHGAVNDAAFSVDGTKVATASSDHSAKIWERGTGKELVTLSGHSGAVNAVAFSADGKYVVTGSEDKTARIWDAGSGGCLFTLSGHTEGITGAAFNSQGTMVVTTSADGTARIWDVHSGLELSLLKTTSPITIAAFSPDGTRVVSGQSDHTVRMWEVQTGLEILALSGHGDGISSIGFSADGAGILTASKDHTVRIWESVSRQKLYVPVALAKPAP